MANAHIKVLRRECGSQVADRRVSGRQQPQIRAPMLFTLK